MERVDCREAFLTSYQPTTRREELEYTAEEAEKRAISVLLYNLSIFSAYVYLADRITSYKNCRKYAVR